MGPQKQENRSSGGSTKFRFVLSDPKGNPKPSDRKVIRSHVMRGKNTRAKSLSQLPTPWIQATAVAQSQLQFTAESFQYAQRESEVSADRCDRPVSNTSNAPPSSLPPSINVLDTAKFAINLDTTARRMVFDFFGTIRALMYPIDLCCEFDLSGTDWFNWMVDDAAYIHALLYTASFFCDTVAGRPLQQRTGYHVIKAIELLNERLADKETALADSTVAVVISMALLCEVVGDDTAALAHTAGLTRMVKMRGGIKSFSHTQQLQVKVCRVDLGMALTQGSQPRFFKGTISWEPFFESSPALSKTRPTLSAAQSRLRRLTKAVNPKLHNIFQDMQDFSQLANFLFQSNQKMQPRVFQDLLTSLQYRLLLCEFDIYQRLAELLRLAMLSYLTIVLFRIPQMKRSYPFLGSQLRTSCQTFQPSNREEEHIFTWSLFVGFMSVFELPDDEMTTKTRNIMTGSLGSSWVHVKSRLKEVSWIDAIYDSVGQETFDKLIVDSRT